MKPPVVGLLVGLVAVLLCGPGYAQEDVSKFPSKPITYIVPVTPGTGTDLSVRHITKEVEKYLKQPIVVVNRPGGALTLGTAAIATAKPDEYTIGFSGRDLDAYVFQSYNYFSKTLKEMGIIK